MLATLFLKTSFSAPRGLAPKKTFRLFGDNVRHSYLQTHQGPLFLPLFFYLFNGCTRKGFVLPCDCSVWKGVDVKERQTVSFDMTTATLQFSTPMPAPAEAVYAWHARPAAFFALQPPWERVIVERVDGAFGDGQRVHLRIKAVGPLWLRWVAELHSVAPGRQFCDRQLQGPFAAFNHTHRMISLDAETSVLEDTLEYRLPLGPLGSVLGSGKVRRQFTRMFAYRHRMTAMHLARLYPVRHLPRRRILVTGSRGMIGNPLCWMLVCGGHEVIRLAHGQGPRLRLLDGTELRWWQPETGRLDPADLADVDAVIHLAGEPIAAQRWTTAQKERIHRSRVASTRLLSDTLARLSQKPAVLMSASAIGWYGDRGPLEQAEDSPHGSGFLSHVCQEWEAATQPAEQAGIRTVLLRIGVVLGLSGGALPQMVRPISLGLGARLGTGRQYVSWISLADTVAAIHHTLVHESLSGPVNLSAPQPVTNSDFTASLARLLRRPVWGAVPTWLSRWIFGQLAEELLLASRRVVPNRLLLTGFRFEHPTLEPALQHELGL